MNCIQPSGAGGGDVEVGAERGLDPVDRGEHLPGDPVLGSAGLVDRQQEGRDRELVDDEVRDADRGRAEVGDRDARVGVRRHAVGPAVGGGRSIGCGPRSCRRCPPRRCRRVPMVRLVGVAGRARRPRSRGRRGPRARRRRRPASWSSRPSSWWSGPSWSSASVVVVGSVVVSAGGSPGRWSPTRSSRAGPSNLGRRGR